MPYKDREKGLLYHREHSKKPEIYRRRKDLELQRKYGITIEMYEQMYIKQKGRCAICNEIPLPDSMGRTLVVDHNHSTGNARKLLCQRCNQAIGLFDENITKMLSAISYLEKHDEASNNITERASIGSN